MDTFPRTVFCYRKTAHTTIKKNRLATRKKRGLSSFRFSRRHRSFYGGNHSQSSTDRPAISGFLSENRFRYHAFACTGCKSLSRETKYIIQQRCYEHASRNASNEHLIPGTSFSVAARDSATFSVLWRRSRGAWETIAWTRHRDNKSSSSNIDSSRSTSSTCSSNSTGSSENTSSRSSTNSSSGA